MKNLVTQIKEILARRDRQYHGECCARCHGAGSHNSCPLIESDPSNQSDDQLLDDIEAALTIFEEISPSWNP